MPLRFRARNERVTNEPSPTVRRAPSSSTPRGLRRTHDQAFAAHLHLGCKSVHRSSAHPTVRTPSASGHDFASASPCINLHAWVVSFFRAIAEATRQPGDVADSCRLSLLGTLNGNEPPCSRPKARIHAPSCMCAAVHCSASATAYALPVSRHCSSPFAERSLKSPATIRCAPIP